MSENKVELYKKLLAAKKEMTAITKDSKNPFFKSSYFDVNKLLSEVEPVLQQNGLLLMQPILENKVISSIIDPETGESIYSAIELQSLKNPQELGSAITYYRRYTLQSLLGLQAEDDDANEASKPKEAASNDNIKWFNINTEEWKKAVQKKVDINVIKQHYKVGKKVEEEYLKAIS